MILFLQCSELFKTTILERNFLRAKYRMPSVTTTSLIHVAPGYGDLVTTNTASYNTTVTSNQTVQTITLIYDEIFDISLNEADSETFLNAFDISGLKIALPLGISTQSAGGATAVFRDSSCAEVLTTVINTSVNASTNTIAQYLIGKIQEKLTALEATFESRFADEINIVFNDLDPSFLSFTLTEPSVSIDVPSSITTIGSKCFGSSSAIVNQINTQQLNAYDVSGTNHLSTSAFPALKGDQFVFALRITNVDLVINKGTFSSNYMEEPTNLPASVKDSIDNLVCAFRFTLDTGGTAFTGLRPY